MFKSILKYGLIVAGVIFMSACETETTDEPVAQVGDKVLYTSNIAEILPGNLNSEDSVFFVNDYVNKWIKQQLLIQKADENLTPEQKNVDAELLAYRNSLIIYKYKNELIKQKMDTVVSAKEIEDYYHNHPDNFNLNRCIVKAIFVKIPSELANPVLVRNMVEDTSEEGLSVLREYCGQYAKIFDISIENWIDFQVLKNNFPIEIDSPEQFLSRNTLKEMNDSNYYYLVSIHDYKLTNDLAPIEFVENNIKNLILNQRKIKFLKDIEENVYTEGIRLNKFRIYNEETNEN
ncbi:hypothetical protein OU798_05990 [Prolixibacteraceae bacterium Z1-6]|uniref:Peptidyl-prolyl cis-trans isomerase n=1 Tax=Draconibacterium aestuarii TaxID=2998507 RepID=A0A9X3F3H3_9BACT|nr:hypothetical protein [Prolixibacteraceae bacterium Z1-6]